MSESPPRSTAKTVLLWTLTVLASLLMAGAGASKFAAPEVWDGLFSEWGYPPAFKTLVGAAEILGAALLLLPRFATYGAALVCAIMVGAIYTVAANDSDLGFVANTLSLVLFAVVGYARRSERWKRDR